MGSKGVALLVAVIGVIALAAAGLYLYRHHGAPGSEPEVATGEKPAAEQPKPESQPAETAPSKPTSVPSFDVVRIEPTGEGVIAGRAQPGWTVTLESGGDNIAETKADEEGAWSVVLDKPLPAGDHSLTLRATSPDGTQALTGQQPVQVAVGEPEGKAVVAQKEPAAQEEPAKEAAPAAPEEQKPAEAPAPEAAKPEQQAEAPQAVPGQPEPVVPDENAPPPVRPTPPVKIGKLDYQDTGSDSGKISMVGVGVPNVHVFFFYDQQPIGDLVIGSDGTWTFEVEKKLGEGEHTVRADTYDAKTGVVQGRASLRLGREPKPEGAQTAAQEPPPQPASAPAAEAPPAEPAIAQAGQPSGQPEPVYPDGPPQEAASPEPSTSVAAVEPQDLSSQPQPVYPEGEAASEAPSAEPSAPVAAAQPQDLSSQPQPTVPEEAGQSAPAAQPEATPAEPTPPVVAEQPSETKSPEPAKAPVEFTAVGSESGKVSLSGTGEPGARVFVYLDDSALGEVSVGSDGKWEFEAERKLPTGEHKFRADTVEEGTGIVISSPPISLTIMEKPAEAPEQEQAAAEPAPEPAPAPEAAPAQEAPPPAQPESSVAAEPEKPAQHKPHRPRVYTVRRGDTLWEIAEAYYGGGWHYRAILRDNRRKIRNPHWIYPRQKFHIPAGR
ncbi:LysM peptidoglycan-binding domain-containing protein [Methyloceanibacter sp.]|uniref:LysM peptidoglycan-binding domain-containing protein n=1 Tax=Methyloceanibacter sp. TaxID=1965321 RepID=UPI003D6D4677